MKGSITDSDGKHTDISVETVKQALAGGDFFWLDLDLHDPGPDDDVTGMLIDTFHFHPIAVDAADRFGQRATLENYQDFTHVVTFGMADDGKGVAEVHCFVTSTFIISLHHGNCPALGLVRDRLATHHVAKVAPKQLVVLYVILDTLVDSFFPVLSDLDDAIDTLETAILNNPTEEQLGTLFGMKRQIMTIRRVVDPQRDMISSLNSGVVSLPGGEQATDEGAAYFRNLYDHLIRISDQVDTYRDLISGAMDTHLSMVSNRLNVIMKQLALVATMFLPLGFLTGFFGQNFAWMQNHLQTSLSWFLGLGVGVEFLAVVGLVVLFKRRGWLGSGPTA